MLDFVVVGPMKTGTSWVHEFLSWHNQVSVPTTVKETYYFSKKHHKGQQWFDKQFDELDDHLIKGEVGPTYFSETNAAELIFKHSPKARIVIILREPYERFLSHYHHNVRGGTVAQGTPLDQAYRDHDQMRGQSEYCKYITFWKQTFGADQVTVLFYEDLNLRPQQFVASLSKTLGIDDHTLPDSLNKKVGHRGVPVNKHVLRAALNFKTYLRHRDMHFIVNAAKKLGLRDMMYSKKNPPVEQIDGREKIFSIFLEESIQLEKELGVDLSHWKNTYNSEHNNSS